MSPHFPALNEITRQTGSEKPVYPDNHEDKRYIILYPDDYEGHGVDVAGNVALLVNEDNVRGIKQLAEQVLEELDDE